MAKIKIEYTEVVAPEDQKVLPICALFEPNGSYIDSPPYDGTVYDTNVEGYGQWEGLTKYLETVSSHPGIMIMFKQAVKDGEVEFEETDPQIVAYYNELGTVLAQQGFKITVA